MDEDRADYEEKLRLQLRKTIEMPISEGKLCEFLDKTKEQVYDEQRRIDEGRL